MSARAVPLQIPVVPQCSLSHEESLQSQALRYGNQEGMSPTAPRFLARLILRDTPCFVSHSEKFLYGCDIDAPPSTHLGHPSPMVRLSGVLRVMFGTALASPQELALLVISSYRNAIGHQAQHDGPGVPPLVPGAPRVGVILLWLLRFRKPSMPSGSTTTRESRHI